MLKQYRMFWLGFSVALGGILAVAVVALAAPSRSERTESKSGARTNVSVPSGPAASVLAVLQRPATAADQLPPQTAATAQGILTGSEGLTADVQPGSLVEVKSRRLLTNLGSQGVSIYAVPTSKGNVCTVFSAVYGSAGCFAQFTSETPVSYDVRDVDQVGAGLPAIVDGLAPDNVVSVDVTADGSTHSATLANNAFFYELPSPAAWPQAITVNYRDGSSRTISIAGVPSPR